jgi:hypothetical protein
MIVYVDSSDLACLDRLWQDDPGAFRHLVDMWHAAGCELGLSFHHAQELSQLADPSSIDRRIELVGHFDKVRFAGFGSLHAMELEIDCQLIGAATGSPPDFSYLTALFFPCGTADDFAELVDEVEPQAKELHGLLKSVAGASTVLGRGVRDLARIRDTDDGPWPSDAGSDFDWDSALETFLDVQTQAGSTRPEVSALEAILRAQIPYFKTEGSFRRGIEAMYGLKDIPIVDEVALENLEEVASYFAVAGSRAPDMGSITGVGTNLMMSLVPLLNPFDCPGMRLKLAVERARRRATPAESASDYVDEEHLPFIAYADIALVDKRTLHHSRSSVGSGVSDLPESAVSHLRRGGTIDRLMAIIEE